MTNIGGLHLEGLTTVPNDTNQYGPWAGKILTGFSRGAQIFTVDALTNTATFTMDIESEDFHIIPTNQDFYLCDRGANKILKLPKTVLTNFVGDMLITQAGELDGFHPAELFIVHWDADSRHFLKRSIPAPSDVSHEFEHGTFAPMIIPSTIIPNP